MVLPLLALANASIELPRVDGLLQPITLGVFFGLVLDTFLGIGGSQLDYSEIEMGRSTKRTGFWLDDFSVYVY